MNDEHRMNRRDFVKTAAAGVSGLLGGVVLSRAHTVQAYAQSSDTAQVSLQYRTLGSTGMKYTTLGFGAMRTSDPAVIRRAVDKGVNNIDTARGYMGGRNEEIVGQAIKDVRKQVHITTKIKQNTRSQMERDIEASLRALGTDYVDVLLLHAFNSRDDVHNEEGREVLQKARKQGKARAVGFSTHSNMADLIREAGEDKFFDVVVAAYNFKHPEDLTEAIKQGAEKGLGIIAMKTQAGGYEDRATENINPHQAALKWALSNGSITSAIPSMVSFQQVEENVLVMGNSFGWQDQKILDTYGNVIDSKLCRLCGECLPQCPKGVQVNDINRCVMYADMYQDISLAVENYNALPANRNVSQCADCSDCVIDCRYGLNVAENIRRAGELFA